MTKRKPVSACNPTTPIENGCTKAITPVTESTRKTSAINRDINLRFRLPRLGFLIGVSFYRGSYPSLIVATEGTESTKLGLLLHDSSSDFFCVFCAFCGHSNFLSWSMTWDNRAMLGKELVNLGKWHIQRGCSLFGRQCGGCTCRLSHGHARCLHSQTGVGESVA